MTKYNDPRVQSLVLDLYATYKMDTKVAELGGVSRPTLWRMSKMSEDGHPDFQNVEWGQLVQPYHLHKLDALDMQVEDIQQRVTRDAADGYWVDEVHGGRYHFVEDEYAMSLTEAEFKYVIGLSDAHREMLDYPRVWHDKMKREYNRRTGTWERVRVKKFIPPTIEAQAKVLAAFAPDVFGDKRQIDLNVRGGLGVSVIGTPIKPPQHVVDITPTVAAITDETVAAAAADEIEYDSAEYHAPEPEPVMSEPEKPFVTDPNSPLTEEQQRILARAKSPNPLAQELAERAARKMAETSVPAAAKPVQPPPPSTMRFDDQDDCASRTPLGQKVI